MHETKQIAADNKFLFVVTPEHRNNVSVPDAQGRVSKSTTRPLRIPDTTFTFSQTRPHLTGH